MASLLLFGSSSLLVSCHAGKSGFFNGVDGQQGVVGSRVPPPPTPLGEFELSKQKECSCAPRLIAKTRLSLRECQRNTAFLELQLKHKTDHAARLQEDLRFAVNEWRKERARADRVSLALVR